MSWMSVLVRAIYLAVFGGCFYYLTYGLKRRVSAAISLPVLLAGLLLLYQPFERTLAATLVRYLIFVIFYALWALAFLNISASYALYLSVFYTILMGVWFSCVQIVFRYFDWENRPALVAAAGLCRAGSVVLMKKRGVEIADGRTIGIYELLIGTFPAATCFLANLVIYEYMDELNALRSVRGTATIQLLVVFFGLSALLILVGTESYFKMSKYKQESESAANQLNMQYQLFLKEKQNDEAMRGMYHDMRNHLAVLEKMAGTEAVSAYVSGLHGAFSEIEPQFQTGNATVDLILSMKQQICREKGIELTAYLSLRQLDFLSPVEICTLFANCIDNAIEAVQNEGIQTRYIHLSGGEMNGNLVVKAENPYSHKLIMENGAYRSTKNDQAAHGYGLMNIRRIVEKHNGALTIRTEDGRFVLVWMIPVPRKGE